jgi:hypothetical protein
LQYHCDRGLLDLCGTINASVYFLLTLWKEEEIF